MNRNRHIRNSQMGFTLIELMVVIAIIGILSAMATVGFGEIVAKERVKSVGATVHGTFSRVVAESRKVNDTLSMFIGTNYVAVYQDSGCVSTKENYRIDLDPIGKIQVAIDNAATPTGAASYRPGKGWAVPGCLFIPPRMGLTPFTDPGFVIVEHKNNKKYKMMIYRGEVENRFLSLMSSDTGATWSRH